MVEQKTKVLVAISGGSEYAKPLDPHDYFQVTVEAALGDWIRSYQYIAEDMWNALVNKVWTHPLSNVELLYSYRSAGDLIATIRGEGSYIDWYCCCFVSKTVNVEIEQALFALGWTWRNITEDDR